MNDIVKDKKLAGEAGGIISAEGKGAPAANFDLEKDLEVHSMPKRFLKTSVKTKKSKGIGAIVLIIGGIFLIAGLAFMYYYLSGRSGRNLNVAPAKEEAAATKEPKKEEPAVKTPVAEEKEKQPAKIEASSTAITKKTEPEKTVSATSTSATSTKEAASSTKVIEAPGGKKAKEYSIAIDSDHDGLTDLEEMLFDCNINSPDSDGDGYNDLSEILNLYNPAGGGSLMVNPNIEKYINSEYDYYLYYPYVWQIQENSAEEPVIFKIANDQFIQVIVQANPDKQTLEDWYMAQMEIDTMDNNRKMYKKGWLAIKSEDNLTVYLAKPDSDKIFIISYSPGISNTLSYKNVFDMMIKSFETN